MDAIFLYYENGREESYKMDQVREIYNTVVDDQQKSQGTTFETWLAEMERMQILNRKDR